MNCFIFGRYVLVPDRDQQPSYLAVDIVGEHFGWIICFISSENLSLPCHCWWLARIVYCLYLMSQFVYVSYTHRYICPLFLRIHGRIIRKDEWICVSIDLNFIDNSLLVITMFTEYKLFSRYQFNSWKSTVLISLLKIMRAVTSLWSWGLCSSQKWVNQLYTVREWIAERPISVFVTQSTTMIVKDVGLGSWTILRLHEWNLGGALCTSKCGWGVAPSSLLVP